ncbi:hypothetical protein [Siphonobacter aquaeclarae]|uniref:Uncharacterized protein n=1 Tax=Siphonobacter aquaeclarae TaxID=563176 RepID=A0A1G9MWW1_9BACT|nr:hypothetical protein [Siphonobacter aquaeclarae]SDL78613.1 hypothetical protein SAMN04488090_1772 [Siphonobacter aquaeclarae]
MKANTKSLLTHYSPSVNIIRDAERELTYYPTPNAERVVHQIANDFKQGTRAFNVIGSYGTGKSSLLWAFEQTLRKKQRFFEVSLVSNATVKFIKFVGEYRSIVSVFAEQLNIDTATTVNLPQAILAEIFNQYYTLNKALSNGEQPLVVLIIDEFGKFLEYAADNHPEQELYFVQQLTEFINNQDYNFCLLTTVHQNFDAYAYSLTSTQRNEWSKVKGRFREITFNEPVEQLLLLMAQHLNRPAQKKVDITESLSIAQRSNSLRLDHRMAQDVAEKLYPLDVLSASVLTIALQRYGQNERSVFSFLQATDDTGLGHFEQNKHNPFYNAANVFDYLIFNYYAFLNSRSNTDYLAWLGIRLALENVERCFPDHTQPYEKLVKAIGLLSLTLPQSAVLDRLFLEEYGRTCLGLENTAELLENLTQRKIIQYRAYKTRYVPNEGTDLDIQTAIQQADVDTIGDVTTLLQRYYQLPPILAKMYAYENGTPRLFEYHISEWPIDKTPSGEVDGYINLIFNPALSLNEVKIHSERQKEAIIYVHYQNTNPIREQLEEIERTQKVIDRNPDDLVAVRELQKLLQHHKNLLNHYILDGLLQDETVDTSTVWVFRGQEKRGIQSRRDLNKLLSQVCYEVYDRTPRFRNELINRHKISSSMNAPKRLFLQRLVNNWHEPDLGFEKDRFPPEKTIYLTLLKENGLVLGEDRPSGNKLLEPLSPAPNSSFHFLWTECSAFLEESKLSRKSVADLVEKLSKRPYKLKQGLIEFWLPAFLYIKRDDFALFQEGVYVPKMSSEVLELINKNPQRFAVKAFSLDGVRIDLFNSYRRFLNQSSELRFGNQAFIEVVRPFLTFYRDLPPYAKQTKRLSKEALAIREAIAQSKEPEKTFFEDFPVALGYTLDDLHRGATSVEIYIERLQDSVRELRGSYDELIDRFEKFITDEYIGERLSFSEYRAKLQSRFQRIRKHLLLSTQKTFLQRLNSPLDDRKAWLNSIAQAVLGKPLDLLQDEDELRLYDKFKGIIRDLDNLTQLSVEEVNSDEESVFSVEITSFVDGITKNVVRMPASKQAQIQTIETSIRSILKTDSDVNIAAIANILKDLLKK